jgi:hypothetical protein
MKGMQKIRLPENCLRDIQAPPTVKAQVGYRLGRWFAAMKMAVVATKNNEPFRLVSVPRIGTVKGNKPFLSFKKEVALNLNYLRSGEGYEYLLAIVSPMGAAFYRMNLQGKFIGEAPPSIQQILCGEVAVPAPQSQVVSAKFIGAKHNLAALEAFLAISYGTVCAEEENALEVTIQALRYLPWETAQQKVGAFSEWQAMKRSAQCLNEVDPAAVKVAERIVVLSTNMGGYEPEDIEAKAEDPNFRPGGTCGQPAEEHLTESACLKAAEKASKAMLEALEAKKAAETAKTPMVQPQATSASLSDEQPVPEPASENVVQTDAPPVRAGVENAA